MATRRSFLSLLLLFLGTVSLAISAQASICKTACAHKRHAVRSSFSPKLEVGNRLLENYSGSYSKGRSFSFQRNVAPSSASVVSIQSIPSAHSELRRDAGRYIDVRGSDGLILRGDSHADARPIKLGKNEIHVGETLIDGDISKVLPQAAYQTSRDGLSWYTNAKIGESMSPPDIEQFEREWSQHKKQAEKDVTNYGFKQYHGTNGSKLKPLNQILRLEETAKSPEAQLKEGIQWSESLHRPAMTKKAELDEDEDEEEEVYDEEYKEEEADEDEDIEGSHGNYVLKGKDLYLANYRGVFLRVLSPFKQQNIIIQGRTVTVNGRVVCDNIRKLSKEKTYQITQDGAKWHTNLNVGKQMTTEEKQEFRKQKIEEELEAEKTLEPTLSGKSQKQEKKEQTRKQKDRQRELKRKEEQAERRWIKEQRDILRKEKQKVKDEARIRKDALDEKLRELKDQALDQIRRDKDEKRSKIRQQKTILRRMDSDQDQKILEGN